MNRRYPMTDQIDPGPRAGFTDMALSSKDDWLVIMGQLTEL